MPPLMTPVPTDNTRLFSLGKTEEPNDAHETFRLDGHGADSIDNDSYNNTIFSQTTKSPSGRVSGSCTVPSLMSYQVCSEMDLLRTKSWLLGENHREIIFPLSRFLTTHPNEFGVNFYLQISSALCYLSLR
ncbi:hypothetical protein I7I50_01642 [Histoplasma capsulatum G186AR]|uniref:Uncharacterized protein n=1 Tax=Ajellomyces capsulatus TaxID=5037 RepID=A0A8H8CSR0_AJECA|nr:hypothetical protein I7I52_11858 [Histoplasma capsulatum]QSS70968.1 hypothetical protein I7I50_01642 [Histoplasma capsulatum G186AR]